MTCRSPKPRCELEHREDGPDDHRGAASWTRPCGAGWRLSHRGSRVDRGSRRWCGEQGACEGHAGGPAGVREESRLADAHEATRQDVLDKATQKLHRGERHGAALIATGVVLVGKGHVLAVEG